MYGAHGTTERLKLAQYEGEKWRKLLDITAMCSGVSAPQLRHPPDSPRETLYSPRYSFLRHCACSTCVRPQHHYTWVSSALGYTSDFSSLAVYFYALYSIGKSSVYWMQGSGRRLSDGRRASIWTTLRWPFFWARPSTAPFARPIRASVVHLYWLQLIKWPSENVMCSHEMTL